MAFKTLIVREDRELPCELLVEERAQKGRELALMLEEMHAEESAEAQTRLEHKQRRGEIEGRINALRVIVATGEEVRTVSVEDWGIHDESVVKSIRTDTKKLVSVRAMTVAERQMPIDFVGENTVKEPETPTG